MTVLNCLSLLKPVGNDIDRSVGQAVITDPDWQIPLLPHPHPHITHARKASLLLGWEEFKDNVAFIWAASIDSFLCLTFSHPAQDDFSFTVLPDTYARRRTWQNICQLHLIKEKEIVQNKNTVSDHSILWVHSLSSPAFYLSINENPFRIGGSLAAKLTWT